MDEQTKNDIIFMNKFLYSVQKHRVAMNNWIDSKERNGIEVSKRIKGLYKDMELQEKVSKKILKEIVEKTGIWNELFVNVQGIGPAIASSLIAEIQDIKKFNTVSKLWAYGGLTSEFVIAKCSNGHKLKLASDKHKTCPIFSNDGDKKCEGNIEIIERIKGRSPKRKKGYHYLFNTRIKTTAWKIGKQFLKNKNTFYVDIYNKEKAKQKLEHPELTPLHIDNRAIRKMVKLFLSHLWEAWMTIEGQEIRPPYVIEKMGHTGYISWEELKERFIQEKEKKAEARKK